MSAISVAQRHARDKVDDEAVRVGKDVIELVTSGMYISPVTVYREFVQNAADAIDAAREAGILNAKDVGNVSITIDHVTRSAAIRDNGVGIDQKNAIPILLAIGNSPKRGTTARGFRGVGRLAGIAYCQELEFRTKAVGEETIVAVVWDCRVLRNRLADSSFSGDLRQAISDAVTIEYEAGERSEHFFEVRMRDVARHRQDVLLNERVISQTLGQVGPVPFHPEFSSARIEDHLAKFGARVPPVCVTVQGEPIYRPYRDTLAIPGTLQMLQIEEVELLEFANVDGEVGAVGWLGHHQYTRSIPQGMGIRGLRARVGDVQIGEANLFDDVFKESRFNGWTLGEIHVLDRRIVPNGRRDNFEVNHHSYNLLAQLGPITSQIAHRARTSSVTRNAAQSVKKILAAVELRIAERRSFDAAELSTCRATLLRARGHLKRISDQETRKKLAARIDRVERKLGKRVPKRGTSAIALEDALTLARKVVTNRDQCRKLEELFRRISG